MKYFLRLFILLLIMNTENASAQSLNGTWTGNYSKQMLALNPESLIVELNIYSDSLVTGLTHLYYKNGKYEHHKLDGIYHAEDSTITFEESYISSRVGLFASVFEAKYKMKLVAAEGRLRFEGKWKNAANKSNNYPSGHKVWLEKPLDKKDSVSTVTTAAATPQPPAANPDTVDKKLSRITDVQKIIEVHESEKDAVKISIYDNGEVDGDSISVYKDDELIVNRKMISATPIVFNLSLDRDHNFLKLKMVAENMGSIPPNTALMIVETPAKRYEVSLRSDFQKTAAVEFVLVE